MSLLDIKYHEPQTLSQAVRLLKELEDARILAGGTDLLVDIKQGIVGARNLISLGCIEELKGIDANDDEIVIGALVTPQEIISSHVIVQNIPALADAARSMASVHIRSMATVGGNIASAVPSADFPPALIAADAVVRLYGRTSHEVSLEEFFLGHRETVCGKGEILTAVSIPCLPSHTGISYQKIALREANALAVVGVAARMTLHKGKIEKATIVLGAVAPTPVRAASASQLLSGQTPSGSLFEEAAQAAKEEGKPISDVRGSAWYRKDLIHVLVRRSLQEALARAQGEQGEG